MIRISDSGSYEMVRRGIPRSFVRLLNTSASTGSGSGLLETRQNTGSVAQLMLRINRPTLVALLTPKRTPIHNISPAPSTRSADALTARATLDAHPCDSPGRASTKLIHVTAPVELQRSLHHAWTTRRCTS